MNRSELNAMKDHIKQDHEKVSDLDVIVAELLKLPLGQLKKVLTEEVLAVLRKYGYTE